jgi:hypothetical protein
MNSKVAVPKTKETLKMEKLKHD